MDLSNRLAEIVKGELRLSTEELTPEERVVVAQTAIDEVRPYLRYFPGFRPLSGFLGQNSGDVIYTYHFEEPLDERAMLLDLMHHKPRELEPDGLTDRSLYFTREGGWVEVACYRILAHGDHGLLVGLDIRVFPLDAPGLARWLEEHQHLLRYFLGHLRQLARNGTNERELRLQHMKDSLVSLETILSHVT